MYFKNGFACRIRLTKAGPYEQSYGPEPVHWRGHPENWRGNDLFIFFLEINFAAMLSYAHPRQGNKLQKLCINKLFQRSKFPYS